jgi:hypothetical protein
MSAPQPRLDEATTDFERELLSSWGTEAPSRQARKRVLALGSQAAVIGAAATTNAASLGGGSLLSAAAPHAATLGLFGTVKWLVLIVVVGASVGATAAFVSSKPKAMDPTVALAATARARGPAPSTVIGEASPGVDRRAQGAPAPAAAVIPRTGAPERARVAPDRPSLVPVPVAQTPAAPSVAAMPPVAASRASLALGDQAALVDRARAALTRGDAATAARLADEYDTRFPSGVLAQEATVVRIQTLVMRGDTASAHALGERFLVANPTSPHAARVRRLLGIAQNP